MYQTTYNVRYVKNQARDKPFSKNKKKNIKKKFLKIKPAQKNKK